MPGAAYGLPTGEKRRPRFVSLGDAQIQVVPDGSTTAVSIGLTVAAEMTTLPARGLVGVSVRILAASSAISTGNYMLVSDYAQTTDAPVVARIPGVANYIMEVVAPFVVPGGIRNRQIKYSVTRAAGTITYYIRIVGYWTVE